MLELIIGKEYRIEFVDPDYPCRCPCHGDFAILHCFPCCSDSSFSGVARYLGPSSCEGLGDFEADYGSGKRKNAIWFPRTFPLESVVGFSR